MADDSLEAYVGGSGEYFMDLLNEQPELLDATNDWFERLGIAYRLRVDRDALTGELGLALTDLSRKHANPLEVTLPQVGYGVSQLLPIVVQAVLGRNQTILIEQPELHIHPELQAETGDLFMSGIDAGQANQFLIETHSETLVLRLQRRIREGSLSAVNLSVVYVEPTEHGATVIPLRIDECGNFIDEWPAGFFEEDFGEIFG